MQQFNDANNGSSHAKEQAIFEKIKFYDESGNEFWKARDLMPLYGYSTFQKFSKPIQKVLALSETYSDGYKIYSDGCKIRINQVVKTIGIRRKVDYHLNRYASYKLASICNTPECKEAISFFISNTTLKDDTQNNTLEVPSNYDLINLLRIAADKIEEEQNKRKELEEMNNKSIEDGQLLINSKAKEFKTVQREITKSVGRSINYWVKQIYLSKVKNIGEAHKTAWAEYFSETKIIYRGSTNSTHEEMTLFNDWLSKKASNMSKQNVLSLQAFNLY